MSRIYLYKLTADNGGAPCPWHGVLSLAICKPMIRRNAKRDDLIFGFAGKSLHPDNRLIYVAVVNENVEKGKYYKEPRFSGRPDRIYRWTGKEYVVRTGARFQGPHHIEHDLGEPPGYRRTSVVVSIDFRYFGGGTREDYKARYPTIAAAVQTLGRGHRVKLSAQLRSELLNLRRELWHRFPDKKQLGKPSQKPSSGVSQRGGRCVVVAE